VSAVDLTIDHALSVNEIIERYPAAMRVLNGFGIDTCCGGATALDVAAHDAGVAVDDLTSAIRDAVVWSAQSAGR
jgi:iron-sulfur cluster repair protein YtfE (RIC family)